MSKASQEEMENLHGAVVREVTKVIREGEQVVTKDGDLVTRRPSAAMLNVARQILKDNNIESGVGNADLEELEKAMKDMEGLPYDGEVPEEYANKH